MTMLRVSNETLKEGSIGDSDFYLRATLQKVMLLNGVTTWSMSTGKYVQDAVSNNKNWMVKWKPCLLHIEQQSIS